MESVRRSGNLLYLPAASHVVTTCAAQGDAEGPSTPKAEVVGALQDNLHALLVCLHS